MSKKPKYQPGDVVYVSHNFFLVSEYCEARVLSVWKTWFGYRYLLEASADWAIGDYTPRVRLKKWGWQMIEKKSR